jgi:hypothetical protein
VLGLICFRLYIVPPAYSLQRTQHAQHQTRTIKHICTSDGKQTDSARLTCTFFISQADAT